MDEKRFVYCAINWKIENFCFACCPTYTIFSPEFILQGMNMIKWRMSLELESPESCRHTLVSFYLEKLTISEKKNLHVSWEVTLTAGNKVFGPFENSAEFGEHCKHGQIAIATASKILENLLPLKPDTISIHFFFIAFDKEKPLKLHVQPARGLFLLSEDLSRLKDTKSYSDIKLLVEDKYIEAHKAVLSRLEKFEACIPEAKSNVIEVSNFDYKTLDEFVHFLYSGNAEHLLRSPSISLMRCLEYFNWDPVKSYYIPEELTMHSEIKGEMHEFHWFVSDILEKDSFNITSPPIKRLNVNTTWNLTISSKFDDNYISIFAKITGGDRPCNFCLEFAIVNEAGEEFFPRRLIRNNKRCDKMGFSDFVLKNALSERILLTEDSLVRFLFRIRTSNGTHECSMGRHVISFVLLAKEQSFEQLSAGISELLKNKNYSDISLKCGNKTIKAHKCILVSRSPEFKRRIDMYSNRNILIFSDIEPDLLENIINYIYTGILEDVGRSRLLQLYNASSKEKLHIPSLREEILRILREKMAYNGTDITTVEEES